MMLLNRCNFEIKVPIFDVNKTEYPFSPIMWKKDKYVKKLRAPREIQINPIDF